MPANGSLIAPPLFERPLPGIVARMPVPGWPQMYSDHVARGRLFLGLYVGLLLPGILFLGTDFGNVLLGLAVAVHISSVMDVVFSGCSSRDQRVGYTALFSLAIALLVYAPAIWLVTRVAIPQRILLDTSPFRSGDVILYNPSAFLWSQPEIGDVVIYDIPRARIAGAVVYDVQGLRLDRIVAGPNQTLEWNGQQLLIDGKPSSQLPLNAKRIPVPLRLSVPEGRYAILPSTDPVLPQNLASAAWAEVSLVPREQMLGKVFLRHQPLHRFWFVR